MCGCYEEAADLFDKEKICDGKELIRGAIVEFKKFYVAETDVIKK